MFKRSLLMFLWMTLITGIVYPLLITLTSQIAMPFQSNGSLISSHDRVIGSRLIGQKFLADKYFWGRPSANDYNGLASGGSHLGPINLTLKELVETRRKDLQKYNQESSVPSDLLFASASGLDPHITVEAAIFQMQRIVYARGGGAELNQQVYNLIHDKIQKRKFGFLGTPTLNVLELNLALDGLQAKS